MPRRRCAVPGCGKTSSLHRLPKDTDVKEKWIQFVFNQRPRHVSADLRVCTIHFTRDCFENKSQYDTGFAKKLLLKHRAVPTVLEPARTPQTEEPGETLGGGSNKGSMWLCPLCQESQPDRDNLSFHLTDKHSVLPACLDKLLDIAAPKHPSIAKDEEPKSENDADETSQQKHLENTKPPSMSAQNESESKDAGDKGGSSQDKEVDEEMEGVKNDESDAGGLESDQDNVEQSVKTPEASVNSGRSANTNSVASEGDNRPFKCNACLESFPTRTALSVHYNSTTHIQRMRTGTVKENDSTPFLTRPYVSNKPYQCAVCRVSYNHAITLESHLKSVLHQSRSRSAGNATPISTANTGNGTLVANLAATTVGSTTQLVNASTSNCVTQANLTTSAVMTKDGDQVQPHLAPSLLPSPVASILNFFNSSQNSLPHSILPSLYTTGASATPGSATPQLISQPQMLMPLVLNGLQTQIQGQNPDSPNQLLQQAVPVLGLSAPQQALLAQRLSGLQSQWAAFGMPTTTQMNLEETKTDIRVKSEVKVEPCEKQMPLISEEDFETDGIKKEFCNKGDDKQELQQLKSNKIVDDGTMCDEKEQEESEMEVETTGEKGSEEEDADLNVNEASAPPVPQHDCSLSCVPDPNHDLSHKHTVNSSVSVNCTFRNTSLALRSSGHRSAKAHALLSSRRPLLTEFQSQVLWAFLESRDDADTSSPQREDCEALGREVGLTGEEVRRWFLDAWHVKDREGLDSSHDERDRSLEDEEGNLMIDESDDGHSPSATGSHAIDLSSSAERHRERTGKGSPRELLLTSDSENEEFYTSVIVTDEESQSSSVREESGSPIKQSSQVETTGERSSGGGKVLRSTTVFLSDAEDEYDDELSAKRKKRKSEIDKEEVEIKQEKQDIDLDLQLEAQADPPTPLSLAVDHQGVPTGILQSVPLSLSLAPLSTQLYSPYVLSLPSSVIGVGVSDGDRGKVAAFSNTQTVTRSPATLSDALNVSATSSLTHSFLSNGNDCESALDLSIGKNHSSTISPSASTANKPSIQKSHLLDGLGLRPANIGVSGDGGLIVVQVKPDSAIAIPSSNNSTITNRNNLAKTSTVYMRAAEKVSTSLMEREKEKEREKERDQKRPKVRRFRDMRRSRTIIHADQLDILYGCYFKDPNPGKHEFEQISEWVNLPKKVVQIWFQNMRARERKGEVRFISDGTLAAVGKPLIKFTWPLSKPIFSSSPKPNPSPSTGWASAKSGNAPPKTDKMKEVKEPLKTPTQGPSRPNDMPSFTVVSTSPTTAHKTKAEATPITMVKIAPKAVTTPVTVPLIVSGTPASRSAQKRKVESDHTDEDDGDYQEGVPSGTTNRMVPKLSTTPINKSSALASQKPNGLKYWSQKGPFKINTLSREQLGLSAPRPTPTTTTPSPVTVTTSSGQSQKETSYLQQNSTPRRPRTHLNGLQLSILQSCYETCAHPNALECEAVGSELGLPLKVVQIWFQNTRAKEKRWRLQQEKMSPNPSDPSKKVDVSSGSYLQYNALRANRPILPKPVQLTVVEPSSSYTVSQSTGRETLRGKCEACGVEFESRAAARDHVFSPRHLVTLKTTNFGQLASLVSNGSGTGSTGLASQSSSASPASNSS